MQIGKRIKSLQVSNIFLHATISKNLQERCAIIDSKSQRVDYDEIQVMTLPQG